MRSWTHVLQVPLRIISHNPYYSPVVWWSSFSFQRQGHWITEMLSNFPTAMQWDSDGWHTQNWPMLHGRLKEDTKIDLLCGSDVHIQRLCFFRIMETYIYWLHRDFLNKQTTKKYSVFKLLPNFFFSSSLFPLEIKPGITYAEPLPQSSSSVSWHVFLLTVHHN